MKLSIINRMRGRVVYLLAAAAFLSVQAGCGSTSDEETELEVGLEATPEAEAENNVAEGFENGGENAVANEEVTNEVGSENAFNNFEANGNATAEGTLSNSESANTFEAAPVSNETADLINDSAGDAFEAPAADAVAAETPGEDPFANAGSHTAQVADPFAANSTATDPFAAPSPEATDPVVTDAAPAAAEASVSLPSQGYVPEDGARMAYHIQVGDTLASISQKIFGNTSGWRQLASDNNLSNPNLIYVGDVLYYPLTAASRKFAENYESSERATVTVKAGDSLSSIAARVYGSEGAWRTLWKENPSIQNPDQLTVGTVLSYRSGGSAVSDLQTEPAGSQDDAMLTTSVDL